MRLFVAVNISKENKNKISKIQSVLKKSGADAKWVEENNLHLTLKFLGEVEENKVNHIIEKLKQVVLDVKKFEVDFESVGVFPTEMSPRVLWIGTGKGAEELKNLTEKTETLFEEIGFEKEKRKFSPHLTVGRFRSSKGKEKLLDIIKSLTFEKITEEVKSVFLIKSVLTPKGSIYSIVEKFCLEGK
jgi:RNA 2',3'-cyclic 3'-phosphodiesterase